MLQIVVNFIFSLGMLFNVVLFFPQIKLLFSQKSGNDLSLFTFSGFCILQLFTILHAYFLQDWLLMIGFGLTFLSCGMVVALILYFRKPVSSKGA